MELKITLKELDEIIQNVKNKNTIKIIEDIKCHYSGNELRDSVYKGLVSGITDHVYDERFEYNLSELTI